MTKEEVSLAVADTGLVNNPNICIKSLGTTFACVCEKCMKDLFEDIRKWQSAKYALGECLNDVPMTTSQRTQVEDYLYTLNQLFKEVNK